MIGGGEDNCNRAKMSWKRKNNYRGSCKVEALSEGKTQVIKLTVPLYKRFKIASLEGMGVY